jgi:uncharacterized Fe-S radical SAM superfamily protein PflX
MLTRYHKILRGKAKPRFLAAQKSGFQKQLVKLSKAKQCPFCNKEHKPAEVKVKISVAEDPTFRNATVLWFGSRGKTKTPAQIAAQAVQKYRRGKKTLIVMGDVAHGLPLLLQILEKLSVPVAIVLAADPLYSEKVAKIFKRIVDIHALTMRWADPGCAAHFGEENYVDIVQKNVASAPSETIVRIPLLPGHLECDAKSALDWISKNAPDAHVQLVQAHKPRAVERAPELNRTVTITEVNDVVTFAHKLSLNAETVVL